MKKNSSGDFFCFGHDFDFGFCWKYQKLFLTAIKAVSSGVSALLSAILAVALFAGMQTYRLQLADSEWLTIFGGFLGADLFILILTCISNIETMLFGKGFQAKLIPEVAVSLVAAMFASGLVHRVCVTTCFLFSLVGLYYVNKISQATYAPPASATTSLKKKK